MSSSVLWLGQSACSDPKLVGGKAANLSRLAATRRVPPGFCLPAHVQVSDADIDEAYQELAASSGVAEPAVAVRSSALDEDGAADSFAGQHETLLNVRGIAELHTAVERCQQSVRAPRALAYRRERGLTAGDARLAVLVQRLVFAEASGVLFSANPITGDRGEAIVTTSWGLGESVVGGTVTPDTYVVRKSDLSILARRIGPKLRMTVTMPGGTEEIDVPEYKRSQPAVSDAQCIDAVRMAITLEAEMGWPIDVECAWQDGICYLLQCRPITTLPNPNSAG